MCQINLLQIYDFQSSNTLPYYLEIFPEYAYGTNKGMLTNMTIKIPRKDECLLIWYFAQKGNFIATAF